MTFGKAAGFPEMFVLDSTDPAQVKTFENKDRSRQHDFHRVQQVRHPRSSPTSSSSISSNASSQMVGADKAGSRFIAVTDPGSKMEQVAHADGFRHIFHGVPSIGGRYSALSDFGMVPAAVMGIDAPKFLDRADVMAISCSHLPARADKNPGVILGLILGVRRAQRPRQGHPHHFARDCGSRRMAGAD